MTVKLPLRILFNLFNKDILSAFNFNSLLLGTQFHSHNELTFGRNSFQDICLQTTQHVRTQYIMKLLDLIFFSNIFKLCQKTVLAPKNDLKQTAILSGLSWPMYGGFVKVPKLWFTLLSNWWFEDLMLLFFVFGNLGRHLLYALDSIQWSLSVNYGEVLLYQSFFPYIFP